jgi:hypothetical protein
MVENEIVFVILGSSHHSGQARRAKVSHVLGLGTIRTMLSSKGSAESGSLKCRS